MYLIRKIPLVSYPRKDNPMPYTPWVGNRASDSGMDWVTDRARNKVRGIASHKFFFGLHVLGICVVLGVEGVGGMS